MIRDCDISLVYSHIFIQNLQVCGFAVCQEVEATVACLYYVLLEMWMKRMQLDHAFNLLYSNKLSVDILVVPSYMCIVSKLCHESPEKKRRFSNPPTGSMVKN